MKSRLVRETSCVHGYFQDCTFLLDSGEPCPGGTIREVEVDGTMTIGTDQNRFTVAVSLVVDALLEVDS